MQDIYARTRKAYDLPLLRSSRVVVVGVGGARSFVETLARTGIGEIALIDPDHSSLANIGTQSAFQRDIDHPKVECLSERLRDIRADLVIRSLTRRFETLTVEELDRLLLQPWSGRPAPGRTLLVMTTDNFNAQAHGNRVALHFGIPSLAAQVYQNGCGAEFSFTHPDSTPACHRCALESRYRAYLEEGFENDVTSDGTPVFCADRVNATLGLLALMILHHGSSHPVWGQLLKQAGNRNLLQLEMFPDSPLGIFKASFSQVPNNRTFFDHTLWLAQKPDHPDSNGYPVCPDCGGTGNLRNAIGTFANDLFEMRRNHPQPT